MDDQEFDKKYWYTNTKLVTVINPRKEDYDFQFTSEVGIDSETGRMKSEQRTYRVPAGGKERFPGTIANLYLNQMSKLIAQDENLIQNMVDAAVRAKYYDDLTVNVEDLIDSHIGFPAFNEKPAETAVEAVQEEAFPDAKAPVESKKTTAKAA